jgi:hypothetical protein
MPATPAAPRFCVEVMTCYVVNFFQLDAAASA